jgi:hypothetical protein
MLNYPVASLLFLASTLPCLGQAFVHAPGQRFFYFKKNGHREAVYATGDVLTFELKGTKTKVSDQIRGFEDSLVVFQSYKVNPKATAAL